MIVIGGVDRANARKPTELDVDSAGAALVRATAGSLAFPDEIVGSTFNPYDGFTRAMLVGGPRFNGVDFDMLPLSFLSTGQAAVSPGQGTIKSINTPLIGNVLYNVGDIDPAYFFFLNTSGAVVYGHVFNTTAVPADGTRPTFWTEPMSAVGTPGAGKPIEIPFPCILTVGCTIAFSTTPDTLTKPGAGAGIAFGIFRYQSIL